MVNKLVLEFTDEELEQVRRAILNRLNVEQSQVMPHRSVVSKNDFGDYQ